MGKINFNEMVRVKLTPKALDRKQQELDDYNRKFNLGLQLKIDKDGYYEDRLWCIMRNFGDMCGFTTNPFENCNFTMDCYEENYSYLENQSIVPSREELEEACNKLLKDLNKLKDMLDKRKKQLKEI